MRLMVKSVQTIKTNKQNIHQLCTDDGGEDVLLLTQQSRLKLYTLFYVLYLLKGHMNAVFLSSSMSVGHILCLDI